MKKIKGIIAPNLTLFNKNNKIDLMKNKVHMEWMINNGVNGFFLTGSYGSGPLMSVEERVEIYKLAVELKRKYDDLKLIAHVGCIDTESTLVLAKEAERCGVDIIASVAPYYYKYSEDNILSFYEKIVSEVSIPVYAYNNPKTTGFTFSLAFIDKLKKCGVKGMKDSSMNCEFLSKLLCEEDCDFDIVLGTSTGWLPYTYLGIDAMIAGMCNYAPEIIYELYDNTMSQNWDIAKKTYIEMIRLNTALKKIDSTILSTLALKARGLQEIYTREPLKVDDVDQAFSEKIENEISKSFENLGLKKEFCAFV